VVSASISLERRCTMAWGYWGIVSGVLILLGVFFAFMEILYARARNGAGVKQVGMEDSQTDESGQHAA
jgi:hypothetical protein